MGLLYLASVIKSMDHYVEIVEILDLALFNEIENPVLSAIEGASLVGISCVTPNVPIVKKIIGLIHPSIQVIVGGPHPTFEPFRTYQELRTSILVGEGEEAIKKVLWDVEHQPELSPMYNGGTVDLRFIPKPARQLIDLHNYTPGGLHGSPIYTSRGCSFNCAFCSKICKRDYRNFPLDRVREEIKEVVSLGIKHVIFGDDDIGLNLDLLSIMDIMEPHHRCGGTTYRLNMSARLKNRLIAKMAASTGCAEISLGVESGSQKILDAMNKNLTVEQAEYAIKLIKDFGIKVKVYLMVNFPGETEETVEETIKFVERTRPDSVFVSSFVPLPGSDTYANPLKYGIIWMSKNWSDYYTVGKYRSFGHCFLTKELSFPQQERLYNLLLKGVGLI
jgi:anaerobic magnesium-protoporphyrin IX monomethyl ester cyclase